MLPQIQNDPVYQLPFLYINGLIVSNDATTPNTVLNVSAGQCRDSNDIMDITLGSANLEGSTVSAPLIINAATNGLNGLDTGSLAASKVYAVYMIADSRYYNPTGAILTLSTNTVPLVPFGYDSMRLIGWWATNSSSHFLKGYITPANGAYRSFVYDAPQATAITAGASTSYAPVNLTGFVPDVNNLSVGLYTAFTPAAASNTLNLQPGNATGDAVTVTAQVAAVVVSTDSTVLAQPTTISSVVSPTVNYKVSAGTVAISVTGYNFSL